MKKGKLSLKKITVSNLSEDFAKRIFGGADDDGTTYGPNCTVSDNTRCTASEGETACNTGGANCGSVPGTGCNDTEHTAGNNNCVTQDDCSYTQCTDLGETCAPTYKDKSCANGPATCGCP